MKMFSVPRCQKRISSENKNTPNEQTVAKDSLPSSGSSNPSNTPDGAKSKEISGTKGQRFLIAGVDSLLYDEVLDDEMLSDFDSSLEGELLVIDESISDDEVDNDGAKETETVEPEAPTVPQINIPVSSSTSETVCSDQSVLNNRKLNKNDLKEEPSETVRPDLNDPSTESCGVPVQPSVSPDSTTTTVEELYLKSVPCRKMSFVLIEDWYFCLSCAKRFTTDSIFRRHVWGHFHRCRTRHRLCIHCPQNQYFSQCPAVNEVLRMLQNSCSKQVSSLRLNLLLNTPPKDKKATDTNQADLAENPVTNNPNRLTNNLNPLTDNPDPLTNNAKPLPKLMPTQLERQTSERTDSSSLKGRSQNLEYLTILIASRRFMCAKCRQRIEPSHLAQHIYRHLHTSTTLPKHGICISERECDIMGKIVPLFPSPEVRKAGFHFLNISCKLTPHRDLTFQIMLISHIPKNGTPRDSSNHPFSSAKEDMQVIKASRFLILNQTKGNCVPVESNANYKNAVIEAKEKVSDDNVIVLEIFPGKKVTPSSAQPQERGYKRVTFVINGNDHICTSCMKGYVSLDLLKAHIVWHFHSNERLCSINHYDGQRSQEKECPILTNIMSCIPKDPERDKELKRVIVYWRKDSEEETAFEVHIRYPKKNQVIDNSDEDDATRSGQSWKDSLKEGIVIDINKHSLGPRWGQNEQPTKCLESNKYQENVWEENKAKLSTETIKPNQKEIWKPEPTNISLATPHGQASQSCESVKTDSKNLSLKSEGGFYICSFPGCKFSCMESKQFLNHLEEWHASEKTFLCVHCGYSVNGPALLMNHMDTHANRTLFLLYRCSMCEYATNLLPDFEKHLRSFHSEKGRLMCCSCKECFRVIDLLLEHLTKNLLKCILCPHCSARDVYRRRMLNHIKVKHPDKPRQIIVSSQIICKAINQNKMKKEALGRKSKNKENIVIVLDDEEEDGDTSKDEHRVVEKEKTTTKSKDLSPAFTTVKETKATSQLGVLFNVLNKVETKSRPHFDWGSLIADDVKSDADTKSKNGEPSSKHRDANPKEKENDNGIVLDGNENGPQKNNNNVKCSSNEGVVRKPILTEMLSNNETNRVNTDDGLKSVETSSEVETKIQKRKSSSEKRAVEDENKKKSVKEHYTVKDISKLPRELKIRLSRTSCSKEISDTENMSPNQASASEKERNVVQLFEEMEIADVQRSPQIPELSGSVEHVPESSQNVAQIPESSQCEAQIPESSQCEARIPESSKGVAQIPESSQCEARIPESSKSVAQIPESFEGDAQIPESSEGDAKIPESSEGHAKIPESSEGHAKIPESAGCEAHMTSAKGLNSSKENNLCRDNSVENDCADAEDFFDHNITTPSLLQEVSLGGAKLDLRLQKCYSKSSQPDRDKQLVCDVCQAIFKTVYRMHLHLLSYHLEWPLWECLDCGRRAYSHSQIISHCWRYHKNQLPSIKSLNLPVIDRKDDNIFVRNDQDEVAVPVGTPSLAGSGRHSTKTMILMPSKFKRRLSSAGPIASTETPKPSAKISRKRSKSINLKEKKHKKERKISMNECAPETINPNSTSSVDKSASSEASMVSLASAASPIGDSRNDGKQPPKNLRVVDRTDDNIFVLKSQEEFADPVKTPPLAGRGKKKTKSMISMPSKFKRGISSDGPSASTVETPKPSAKISRKRSKSMNLDEKKHKKERKSSMNECVQETINPNSTSNVDKSASSEAYMVSLASSESPKRDSPNDGKQPPKDLTVIDSTDNNILVRNTQVEFADPVETPPLTGCGKKKTKTMILMPSKFKRGISSDGPSASTETPKHPAKITRKRSKSMNLEKKKHKKERKCSMNEGTPDTINPNSTSDVDKSASSEVSMVSLVSAASPKRDSPNDGKQPPKKRGRKSTKTMISMPSKLKMQIPSTGPSAFTVETPKHTARIARKKSKFKYTHKKKHTNQKKRFVNECAPDTTNHNSTSSVDKSESGVASMVSLASVASPKIDSPNDGKKTPKKKSKSCNPDRNNKFKRQISSAGPSASTAETPKQTAKTSRKKSKSKYTPKKKPKKQKKSSVNKCAPETIDPNSTSSVDKSASSGASMVSLVSVASPKRDSPNDGKKPPKKKFQTCNPDRNAKKCSMCDFHCSSKSNQDLLQHMIQKHMRVYQHFISEEEIEQVEDAITGDSLQGFVCPFCSQNMQQRVSCKIHIWRVHARLKYLHCSQCEFVTWFECHMQRHVADNHVERQASGSTKDEETPVTGVNHLNSSPVTSTPDSQI